MNYANNVLVSLSASVGLNDTSITFLDATTPMNNPPAGPGLMTLADNYNLPTKLEIFSYTGVTDNGNGSFTLTGCTRGLEGTTNQQWQVGHVGYMSFTADRINNFSTQTLTSSGDTTVGGDLSVTGDSSLAAITGSSIAVTGAASAASISEGGTALSAKYLGINATAVDSSLLAGQSSTYYRNASNMNAGTLPAARLSGSYAINADTASALETARTISLAGDLSGSALFDGSGNISITAAVANDSHTHATQYLGLSANAVSASKLATARTISLTGDASGSVAFDGSANAAITVTVVNDSHTHATQYLGLTAKAADSDKLDNLNSSSFLRSDTTDHVTSGALYMDNNIRLYFSTTGGAEFFHNNSNMYTDINTGDWYVRSGTTTRYLFDVSAGNFHADGHVYWQSGSVGSDPELKKNARVIDNPIKRLQKLNGYFFEWIDGKKGLTGGLMSPEIRKALPGTVHKTGGLSRKKKYDQFDYNCATGLLVEVAKNHELRMAEMAYQLAELKAELETL